MRTIVHLDADAFFASVEQAADPRLRGRAVAVGGEKRGVIASASYEARQMGIYTPMPTVRARKLCPKLIVLPGDFEKYERFSRWMFSYAQDFTPDVEITSIDEGYFDLSGVRQPPLTVAGTIRDAIRQALKISVSEGIAGTKLVSQIASKLNKPAAFLHVPAGQEICFLHPLPNRWLPGVGPHHASRLNAAGLALIRHVAATPLEMLQLLLGKWAATLREYAYGIDPRPIVPISAPAKSYSQQQTFEADLTDEEYAEAVLRRMADHLMATVRAEAKSIRTLTVKVRYNDMAEDQCGESLAEPTDLETEMYGLIHRLFRRAWQRRVSLRMVGLKLSNVYDGIFRAELALDRPAEQLEARRRLAAAVDGLRQARGHAVILRGHDFRLREAPAPPGRSRGNEAHSSRMPEIPHVVSYRPAIASEKSKIKNQKSKIECVPLAVHSYYSFLNSTLPIDALVALAERHQWPALALADQGNLHGAVEFVLAAKGRGLKPIIGAELQVDGQPVWLYVETAQGYHNLCRLLSEDPNHNRHENSRCRRAEASVPVANETLPLPTSHSLARLEGLAEGLVAVSAHRRLSPLFPRRFYYAAVSPDAFRRANTHLPGVAVFPVHYAELSDRWKFDVVQSIRTRTLLRQEHPAKLLAGDFHLPAPAELGVRFRDCPALLTNTLEIAERCAFELPLGPPQFPAFHPPDGSPPGVFLRRLVADGLRRRYGTRAASLQSQIEEELAIIQDVGYEEYFLVVWDLLEECRRQGIEWLTRGSAADSLVCYCLGISDVCPIRFDLYFRRFLNKDRMALHKLPDIDVDFPHDRKDDVVDLVFAKYGRDHAAVVGGFSTFQARSAVGEVAKVLGVSEHQVRRFTEHFPWAGARGIEARVDQSLECRDLPLYEEPYRSALQMAEFLDGFPRYPKMHPCGVVLSRQPMRELTPTFVSQKGYPTTHFDMDAVEAVGLVKMDLLAQAGLAVMRDVHRMLAPGEETRGKTTTSGLKVQRSISDVPLSPAPLCEPEAFPWSDPAVWDLIASGNARAVHHIESPAMLGLCKMCHVRDIDGLIAIVSVIRPGAANEQKKLRFTRRYQGLEPPVYPHPTLEPYLKNTFGLVVYEEHVLQICEAFAGLPAGRADVLRRALGKEKSAVIEEIRREFFACARARGHGAAKITEVWDLLASFAGYAFCKAHSTAYGVEAYESAWLKKYHPVEFMAAVLTNGKGFYHPLVYVLECHRLGIPLLPPWINEPGPAFTVCPLPAGGAQVSAIRVPVTRVKGLTDQTEQRLLEQRACGEFASLADFYRRVRPAPEEFETLIRVGAFDGFGQSRTAQFWESQRLCRAYGSGVDGRQGWLLPPPATDHPLPIPLQEPTRRQRLEWENELLDFTASGHPLELHDDVAWETYCPVARLGEHLGETVVACGLVIEQRTHHQVTGEPMKFLTLADWTGIIETEMFADSYRSYGLATVRYPVLEVTATVEPYENGRSFSLRIQRAGPPRKRSLQPHP